MVFCGKILVFALPFWISSYITASGVWLLLVLPAIFTKWFYGANILCRLNQFSVPWREFAHKNQLPLEREFGIVQI